FSPVEDCIPTEPVLVDIKRVISGDAHGSEQLWFCDHYTENPAPLKAGKTYIAGLWNQDNAHSDVDVPSGLEFIPWLYPYSTQTDVSGVKVESEMNMPEGMRWEEVTENFYRTTRGKGWLSIAENETQMGLTIPVLPTESCSLLPAFHEKEATVINGREIAPEEFQDGRAVCMVTQEFAKLNDLQLGDHLRLPLYFANHHVSPGYTFGYNRSGSNFSFANAQGERYPVFWESDYEIVGIYQYNASALSPSGSSEMGIDMVIIPTKSVKASDDSNISDYGPIHASTTSFQIPNGSIAKFDAAFQALPESKFLKIAYDDNGYEQVAGSLQQTKNIATLLCAVGLLSSIMIILLLLYFFIIRQKKRTAIERSLGMSRHQCRISLVGGIMVLTIAATLTGSIIGVVITDQMDEFGAQSESAYSMEFSSWATEEVREELTGAIEAESGIAAIPLAFGVFGFLVLLTCILSLFLVNKNLEAEPILLLSLRGE
ncbi:MAG: FtsX-like permease family protein, partial [Ruthenibacterium sp.]